MLQYWKPRRHTECPKCGSDKVGRMGSPVGFIIWGIILSIGILPIGLLFLIIGITLTVQNKGKDRLICTECKHKWKENKKCMD